MPRDSRPLDHLKKKMQSNCPNPLSTEAHGVLELARSALNLLNRGMIQMIIQKLVIGPSTRYPFPIQQPKTNLLHLSKNKHRRLASLLRFAQKESQSREFCLQEPRLYRSSYSASLDQASPGELLYVCVCVSKRCMYVYIYVGKKNIF